MNFDELLDFLFHRVIGVCITVASSVLLMMALTGCLPNDFIGCFWQGCGCTDCADACYECSESENSCYYSCLGGKNSCALVQCLFGPSGCEEECGDCYVDCGGANSDCFRTVCFGSGFGEGCYETSEGHQRYTCMNCTAYCDGTNDPGSPNFQRVFLFMLELIDNSGNMSTYEYYQNTSNLPYESLSHMGLTFRGYYSADDVKYTDEYGNLIVKPNKAITLYARYQDSFAGMEFTFTVMQPVTSATDPFVPSDVQFTATAGDNLSSVLSLPEEVPGYSFVGWYVSRASSAASGSFSKVGDENGFLAEYATFSPGSSPYNFSYTDPNRTISIVPYYEPTKFTVTVIYPDELAYILTANGLEAEVEYKKTHGESISDITANEDILASANYKFVGFAYSPDLGNEIDVIDTSTFQVTENLRLYVICRELVTITFRENEDTEYSITYYDGEHVVLPEPKNINTGDEYIGWSFHNNFSSSFTEITVSKLQYADVILIPCFNTANYTITYKNELGEDLGWNDTYQYNVQKELRKILATDLKYSTFICWVNENTGARYESGYLPSNMSGDITLIMETIPKKYTITLQPVPGTVTTPSVEQTYGEDFKLEIPTLFGSTFKYWYYETSTTNVPITDSEGNSLSKFQKFDGAQYLNDQTLDITLYAAWEKNQYSVTFDSNGTETVVYYDHNQKLEKPLDPSKPGHTFIGWFCNESGTEENITDQFETKPVTSDMRIYAKFEPRTYKVTFDLGSSGAYFDYGNGETSTTFELEFVYTDEKNYTISGLPAIGYSNTDDFLYGWYKNPSPTKLTPASEIVITQANQIYDNFKALLVALGDGNEITVYGGIFSIY